MKPPAEVIAAYHEAGHAVGAYLLGFPIGWIALGDPGQGSVSTPLTIREIREQGLEWANAVVYWVGPETERLYFGRAERRYRGADEDGVKLIRMTFFSDMDWQSFLAELRRRTADVVGHRGFRPAVKSLAGVVLRDRDVSAERATDVIRTAMQSP